MEWFFKNLKGVIEQIIAYGLQIQDFAKRVIDTIKYSEHNLIDDTLMLVLHW